MENRAQGLADPIALAVKAWEAFMDALYNTPEVDAAYAQREAQLDADEDPVLAYDDEFAYLYAASAAEHARYRLYREHPGLEFCWNDPDARAFEADYAFETRENALHEPAPGTPGAAGASPRVCPCLH